MAARRGQCPICRCHHRLRKDGTLQAHSRRDSQTPPRVPCGGKGELPVPYDPSRCWGCQEYYYGTPGLVEAIWSVAIESPKPGDQIMREFLEAFHNAGHREVA